MLTNVAAAVRGARVRNRSRTRRSGAGGRARARRAGRRRAATHRAAAAAAARARGAPGRGGDGARDDGRRRARVAPHAAAARAALRGERALVPGRRGAGYLLVAGGFGPQGMPVSEPYAVDGAEDGEDRAGRRLRPSAGPRASRRSPSPAGRR